MPRRRREPVTVPRPSLISRVRVWLPYFLVGIAAFLLVVIDLDPTGAYPWLPDGPGLTVDESFNVEQGVRLEIGSRYVLLGALSIRELFGTPDELGPDPPAGYHLPDHPPLGRYLLGVAHDLSTAVVMPTDWPSPFVIAAARLGSAAAFGMTVFLIALFAGIHYGNKAGVTSGVALILMPRVFGHAHIASLETILGLAYVATVMFLASTWKAGASVSLRDAFLGGMLLGLVFLTKVQAVFLPIPLSVWALWHWRQRAIIPLSLVGATSAAVFFLGWPWLWFDPLNHVLEYLGRTTDRLSLPVWYQGQVFADKEVPWHYPTVMFLVTIPIGLHLLGLFGVFGKCMSPGQIPPAHGEDTSTNRPGWHDPRMQLVLACGFFPLLVFSLPGVAVYDGARLFLVAYPLWAIAVGRGGQCAYEWIRRRRSSNVAITLSVLFFSLQAYGVMAYRPVYLSYYNALVGGLAGAERLGFESTYWGDSMTPQLLETAARELPEGGTLAVSPVLHQFQLETMLTQAPALQQKNVRLVEYGSAQSSSADALLIFARKASLPAELQEKLADGNPSAAVRVQGVTLAAFYRLSPQPIEE